MLRMIYSTVVSLLLFLALLLANCVQLLSLLVWPFSKAAFRAINRFCCWYWYSLVHITLEKLLGVDLQQTGDLIPMHENCILLSNHQAMTDVPVLLSFAARYQSTQDTKWFAKSALRWMPGVGWGLMFLDCLFVERNWTADQQKVMDTFAKLRERKAPFWVVSFVEGTRAKPEKIRRSQAYAAKEGLPPLKNLLLPRTKGFTATLDGLGGLVDAVYDATIGYEGAAPSITQTFLLGSVKRIHLHVRRYPLASLPKSEKERAEWLQQRFREKDALLEKFRTSKSFG